jgi:membrane protease YdiL (CAAX protease family)
MATIKDPVPPARGWKIHSTWIILVPIMVTSLIGLAILFPSPKHDRSDMLYIVATAPLGEEVLFRGLLWSLATGYLGDKSFLHLSNTIWLTALGFGLMHLQYHHFQIHLASIMQMSYSFAAGLILGLIREQMGSVVPAIYVHSAFNSVFNLLLSAVQ